MKKTKIKHIIIYLLIILVILIFALIMAVQKNNEQIEEIVDPEIIIEPTTIQEVLEKYDSEYIKREKNKIYVKFGKDLYDEEGNSNQEYFYKIMEELKPYFEENFTLIDEEKNIKIYVYLDSKKSIINDKENFYEEIDGKDYSGVDKVEIVDKTTMYIESPELGDLVLDGMFMTGEAGETLGEEDPVEREDGYKSYQNGNILIDSYEFSKRARNVIFSNEYKTGILPDVTTQDSLQTILEKYPEPAFGSIKEGYLGYRTKDIYIFFYDDEISVYGYSYTENTKMEEYIEEYLETRDLNLFKKRMVVTFENFHEYTYDAENQNLYISYPSIGLEINIQGNDPTGITLYQNYRFTDKTKKLVKDGLVKLESNVDFLEKIEKERVSR